jgi:alkylhydroperoxidase/carboxymuconolactone decarboxylase family protein YurZ
MVLRCDDCIFYHLDRCHEEGVSSKELQDAMAIALVVGGSIVIPHLRRAVRAWEELASQS